MADLFDIFDLLPSSKLLNIFLIILFFLCLIDIIVFIYESRFRIYVITSDKIKIIKKNDKYYVKVMYYSLFGLIPLYKYWCHYIQYVDNKIIPVYWKFETEEQALSAAKFNKVYYKNYFENEGLQ